MMIKLESLIISQMAALQQLPRFYARHIKQQQQQQQRQQQQPNAGLMHETTKVSN